MNVMNGNKNNLIYAWNDYVFMIFLFELEIELRSIVSNKRAFWQFVLLLISFFFFLFWLMFFFFFAGELCVHIATLGNHIDILRQLMCSGADLNARVCIFFL